MESLYLAGTIDDSVVDGEGVRYTVFVQGCPRRCPGCHNKKTQSFVGGKHVGIEKILAELDQNPLLDGLTLSGGEPFTQSAALASLAREAHARGLDVWTYTGYTIEELRAQKNAGTAALLKETDVLVDGEYREAERDLTLAFRGSRNQRVIDLKASRAQGRLVLLYDETAKKTA